MRVDLANRGVPPELGLFLALVGVKALIGIASNTPTYFPWAPIVIVLTVLLCFRVSAVRWLLILLILAQSYAVWLLQDESGFSALDICVLILNAAQIVLLVMPGMGAYLRDGGKRLRKEPV